MEPLLAWVFLAVVVEVIIQILSDLFPILDDISVNKFNAKKLLALILGTIFAFGAQLDFFMMVNIEFNWPHVGMIISAIFIMAGSNYIHDIIGALTHKKHVEELYIVEVRKE